MCGMRTCDFCGHSEINHWGHSCAHKHCRACFGFMASGMDVVDYLIAADELFKPRGLIGDNEVLDEYSAIREHLGRVMETASQ